MEAPKYVTPDPRNQGKVAIITGASTGLGAASAIELAAKGFTYLSLIARDEAKLSETKAACLEAGAAKVLVLPKDLSKPVDVCIDIVEKTIQEFGRLDVLVNNAGVSLVKSARDIEPEDIDNLLSINLKAAMLLTKHALPHLEETKGCVINISSVAGNHISVGNQTIYW